MFVAVYSGIALYAKYSYDVALRFGFLEGGIILKW